MPHRRNRTGSRTRPTRRLNRTPAAGQHLRVLAADQTAGAVRHHPSLEAPALAHDPAVVQVHHRGAPRIEPPEDRPLLPGHPREGAQSGKMRRRHRGDEGEIRIRDGRKPADLSRTIGTQFHHRRALLAPKPQQRQRQTHQVVVVAFGLEHLAAQRTVFQARALQNGEKHLFGGGLSVRPGDGQDPQRQLLAMEVGDVAQGLEGIAHPNHRHPLRVGDASLHNQATAPAAHHFRDEHVPIPHFAAERHEHAVLVHLPRIRADVAKPAHRTALNDGSLGGSRQLFDGPIHGAYTRGLCQPPTPCTSSRNTCRSSNWSRRSPTIW